MAMELETAWFCLQSRTLLNNKDMKLSLAVFILICIGIMEMLFHAISGIRKKLFRFGELTIQVR